LEQVVSQAKAARAVSKHTQNKLRAVPFKQHAAADEK
jgi:hypothetical protein